MSLSAVNDFVKCTTYESNVLFTLRFMVDCKVRRGGTGRCCWEGMQARQGQAMRRQDQALLRSTPGRKRWWLRNQKRRAEGCLRRNVGPSKPGAAY